MAIVPVFSAADIKAQVESRISKIRLAVINRLKFTGESFVKNARENANFKDRTGNLRASIGYAILDNGQPVEQNFSGGVGGANGLKVALEVAEEFPAGLVLIVVAGMEYAAAVESRNYDVITSSSLLADDELTKGIKELSTKISKLYV